MRSRTLFFLCALLFGFQQLTAQTPIWSQHTNAFPFTNGTILLSYNDTYDSIGNTYNFLLIDNIRLERSFASAIPLLDPHIEGDDFQFSFATEAYTSYTVQWTTNITTPAWNTYTNVIGSGYVKKVVIPISGLLSQQYYFRVTRP
jgi:hypothetical protein